MGYSPWALKELDITERVTHGFPISEREPKARKKTRETKACRGMTICVCWFSLLSNV